MTFRNPRLGIDGMSNYDTLFLLKKPQVCTFSNVITINVLGPNKNIFGAKVETKMFDVNLDDNIKRELSVDS